MILSNVLIIAAVFFSLKNKGSGFWGTGLTQRQAVYLVVAELILLLLCILDYSNSIDPNAANDVFWHNMLTYYRGMLPMSPLISLLDDFIPDFVLLFGVFISALIVDYIILRITSLIKKLIKK